MRKPLGSLLILIIGVLLGAAAGLIGNVAADQLPPWIKAHGLLLYIVFYVFIGALAVAEYVREQRSPRADTEAGYSVEREFLTRLCARYTTRLDDGLKGLVQITLELHELPSALAHPGLTRREGSAATESPLPAGTKLIDEYDRAESALLVLGRPGAGKTMTLLQLALDLAQRADPQKKDPLPVVFDLATWPGRDTPFEDWMQAELKRAYGVSSPALARRWIRAGRIAVLLDGFDEVVASARAECMQAINQYHEKHGFTSLVVCSRQKEYDEQPDRLDLRTAVVLQPLTPEQVMSYLDQGGANLDALRAFVQHETPAQPAESDAAQDESLYSLFQIPLFLNMAIVAYKHATPEQIPAEANREAWVRLLFGDYVRRMLGHRLEPQQTTTKQAAYTEEMAAYYKENARHYLHWLAQQMQQPDHNLVTFYLEDLQPDWLPNRAARNRYSVGAALLLGLVVGLPFGVISGLTSWLVFGLSTGQNFGLNGRFIAALLVGVSSGLLSGLLFGSPGGLNHHIRLSEVVTFVRPNLVVALVIGLPVGLIFGLVGGLFDGPIGGLIAGLGVEVVVGLMIGLAGLETTPMNAEDRQLPGQGLHQSLLNGIRIGLSIDVGLGLVIGLGVGLVGGVLEGGLGIIAGLLGGLVVAMLVGMSFGLRGVLQHFMLRCQLQKSGMMPRNYVAFLDYATTHILLQRVGGGYRFIHLSLRDYFAGLPDKG